MGGTSAWRDYGPYGMPFQDTVYVGQWPCIPRSPRTPRRVSNTSTQRIITPTSNVFLPRHLGPDHPGVDINRYAYAGNDPINGMDPGGHSFGSDTPGGAPDNINGAWSSRDVNNYTGDKTYNTGTSGGHVTQTSTGGGSSGDGGDGGNAEGRDHEEGTIGGGDGSNRDRLGDDGRSSG